MKRNILTLSGAGIAAAILSSSAFADLAGSTAAHVYVNVDPNVSVGVLTSNLQLPTVQVGTTTANVGFRVDANQENVWLGILTTDLYKGDDPTNSDVNPLGVDLPMGATITPDNATPTQGATNVAVYNTTPTTYNGFNAYQTNYVNFESSQNGHFSQDIHVAVGWDQNDPEQPQGEYSGYVVLYTALQAPPVAPGAGS
ncbi:MAG TPA: hypothetical protein VKA13_07105 [Gammaproteobacteria bacterium]|nr:hypothetical protein [Gammaproteobacteria bacterium]